MTKKIKINKNKGILFFITGLSGSGKTTISKKIRKEINSLYGPTICVSGDDIRRIMKLDGFTKKDRLKYGKIYSNFCKLITTQNVNILLATVGLVEKFRKQCKKDNVNYVEIYIKCTLQNIIKNKKKKLYLRNKKNIVGIDITPEYPQKPDIIMYNDFRTSLETLSKKLLIKINNLISY